MGVKPGDPFEKMPRKQRGAKEEASEPEADVFTVERIVDSDEALTTFLIRWEGYDYTPAKCVWRLVARSQRLWPPLTAPLPCRPRRRCPECDQACGHSESHSWGSKADLLTSQPALAAYKKLHAARVRAVPWPSPLP